jgi:outer membrane protein
VLLAATWAWAWPVQAADLMSAYALARESNAGLQSAKALQLSAQPRAAQAAAVQWPAINATGSSSRTGTKPPASALDPAGGSYSNRTSSLSVNLRQPLYNRGAAVDVRKADTSVALAEEEFALAEQDFIVRVAAAYFDVLGAMDLVETNRASQVSIAGQLSSATRNFEAGNAIVTDVRDAQARYDLSVAELRAAENELQLRRLVLARLVQQPDFTPKRLHTPVVLPPPPEGDVSRWTENLGQHPSMRRAQLQKELAELDVARARSAYLPTVDAVASYTLSRSSNSTVGPAGNTRGNSIGVELNLPLFSGFSTDRRITETQLLAERARQEVEVTRQAVTDGIQRAFFDLQSAYAQAEALAAAEVSGALSLEATQKGYRAGVRLNLDVLNAQALLFKTRRDLAKARYDALVGFLRLRLAAGVLAAADLRIVNAALVR